MELFHRTAAAAEILRDGWRDSRGAYLTQNEYEGVWFADEPLGENEGASGWTVLKIEIPDNIVAEYEWLEESTLGSKGFREFHVPAEVANKYLPALIHADDWAGYSQEAISRFAEAYDPGPWGDEQKAVLIAHIDFLKRHGLLADN